MIKIMCIAYFLLHSNIHPWKVVVTVVDQISEEKKRR